MYQISRTRALAYELAHATTQKDDSGYDIEVGQSNHPGLYIINTWENPIMSEIEYWNRTSYSILGF